MRCSVRDLADNITTMRL